MLFYIRIRFQDDVSLSIRFFFFVVPPSRYFLLFSYLFFFAMKQKGDGDEREIAFLLPPREGEVPVKARKRKVAKNVIAAAASRKIVFKSFRLCRYQMNLARRGKKKRRKRYKDAPYPRSTLFILKCVIRPTP